MILHQARDLYLEGASCFEHFDQRTHLFWIMTKLVLVKTKNTVQSEEMLCDAMRNFDFSEIEIDAKLKSMRIHF